MSNIGNTETSPEIRVTRALWGESLRGYRKNYEKLPGTPDIAYTKCNLVIFVDGCFWHGCPKCFREPENNKQFWKEKIERNQERDREVNEKLRSEGWKVLRIWEHTINEDLDSVIKKVKRNINNG